MFCPFDRKAPRRPTRASEKDLVIDNIRQWRIMIPVMEFIETSVFTRLVLELLSDEAYRELQISLADNPVQGALVPGGGGIRKLRFGLHGTGKRGGVRVIYYWLTKADQIYMLLVYPKGKQENLTEEQKRILKSLVKELNDGRQPF